MTRIQPLIIKRIQTLISRRTFTMSQLEDRAQISRGYLRKVLDGKHCPDLPMIGRLEKAFGSPILTIAGRVQTPQPPRRKLKTQEAAKVIAKRETDDFDTLLDSL